MIPYKLSAKDKATMLKELAKHGVTFTDEEGNDLSHNWAHSANPELGIHDVTLIGEVRLGGEYDSEGNELVPPEVLDGYHADVLSENEIAWGKGITTHNPSNPVHTYQ